MGLDDKASNKAQEMGGKVKEATGAATGDDSLKHEGQADQGEGKLKQAGEHVKDAVGDAKDALKK